jgi:hypothetical protein
MKAEFKGAKGCSVGYAEGELSLRYHDTVVARFYFDVGALILDHGGWRTYYTKERINRFCNVLGLPVGVHQRNKFWFITPDADQFGPTIDWGHIDDGDAPEICINTEKRIAA